MNLPNKLTLTRIVLAPVFALWFFITDIVSMPAWLYGAVMVLIVGVMELTDLLDGKIARRRHLVTDLGKVMDPFGDVIIHLTYFTCFLTMGIMPVWAFLVIAWREFAQSFMRMLLMGKGTALAANYFGKAKTWFYAFSSFAGIACRIWATVSELPVWTESVCYALFAISAVLSALSFIVYMVGIKRSGALASMTR